MRPQILSTTFCLALFFWSTAAADEKPPYTDYCARLEHEIQNRKHGFLSGNITYYVGGFHASWKPIEHETIGLTHPFHHDLRSRGVGLLKSNIKGAENTGTGNDYEGWEFYKDTRVLYGSVVIDGKATKHPKPTSMRWRPDKLICEYRLNGITIREEKFVAANDSIASKITSSKPVKLVFDGRSFFHRNSVKSTAKIRTTPKQNGILISEGGTVRSRPDPKQPGRVGPCVYSGMTTAICVSETIADSIEFRKDKDGVCHYTFSVPCDKKGIVVSWSMHDKEKTAMSNAMGVVREFDEQLQAKTKAINALLNNQVPWFRCPDRKFVDIYYYLWSLYLMYYIDVGKGWEQEAHTQTAVNNFLGMHRYDAAFQIRVGAWTENKSKFAYGNVLTWKHLSKNNRYRELPNGIRMISDNKGISWHSGAYGPELSEHVLAAWQVYEHTGDKDFIRNCYQDHFDKIFAKRISGFAMNEFEVASTLSKMARLAGEPESKIDSWNEKAGLNPEHIRRMFEQRWEMNGVKGFFAAPKNGMMTTNSFWAMRSPFFPREYANQMVNEWAIDKQKGFFGDFFPLAMSKQSMIKFQTNADDAFGYTPDTAYFVLDGMFRQDMRELASRLTLNHLQNFNFHKEWGVPVAPEAYRRDGSLFGDQYSNFNAGKILLYLEGLAGLEYSIPKKKLTVRPALPGVWEWMEVRLPIDGKWTKVRYSRDSTDVVGCTLEVEIKQPGAN